MLLIKFDYARSEWARAERWRKRWGPSMCWSITPGRFSSALSNIMTLEDFEEVMRVNFWGAVHATLAVLPGMRRRGEGRVVNITSVGGKVAFPHLLPYTASKFALVGFSEGLRAELCKNGIWVHFACLRSFDLSLVLPS